MSQADSGAPERPEDRPKRKRRRPPPGGIGFDPIDDDDPLVPSEQELDAQVESILAQLERAEAQSKLLDDDKEIGAHPCHPAVLRHIDALVSILNATGDAYSSDSDLAAIRPEEDQHERKARVSLRCTVYNALSGLVRQTSRLVGLS